MGGEENTYDTEVIDVTPAQMETYPGYSKSFNNVVKKALFSQEFKLKYFKYAKRMPGIIEASTIEDYCKLGVDACLDALDAICDLLCDYRDKYEDASVIMTANLDAMMKEYYGKVYEALKKRRFTTRQKALDEIEKEKEVKEEEVATAEAETDEIEVVEPKKKDKSIF